VQVEENVAAEQTPKKGGKGKGKLAIIICLIVVIVLLGVIIFLLLRKKDEPAPPQQAADPSQRDVLVNEDNLDRVLDEMSKSSLPPDNYEATMNSTWNFPDGEQASPNAYVENSTSNQNDVYFDLELSDTGEVIYESPVIPVGSHLDKIKLDKDLDAGTYECVLTYHLLDEKQNTLGTVKMVVTVIVEG
jgi:hypothetical protein